MARLCWAAGWPLLVGALATNLISGLLPTATAWLTKLVVDGIVSGRPQVALLGVAGGLATVGIATGVLPQLVTYLQSVSCAAGSTDDGPCRTDFSVRSTDFTGWPGSRVRR